MRAVFSNPNTIYLILRSTNKKARTGNIGMRKEVEALTMLFLVSHSYRRFEMVTQSFFKGGVRDERRERLACDQ